MKTLYRFKLPSMIKILAMGLVVWSCSGGTQDQSTKVTSADTLYPEAKLSAEIKQELYALPTPIEIARILETSKAGYIFDITNPPGNVGKYLSEREKALNLGIYSADLAYSATYGQHDAADKFLSCTSKLSSELGIEGIYQTGLVERFKRFGNNRDSLVNLVDSVLMHTSALLSMQNRHYLAILIATGAFVEGLFLASELNVVAKDNARITKVILNQQTHLNQLLTVLESFRACKHMDTLYLKIAPLQSVFTDFGLETGKTLDRKKAIALSDLVEKVRNEII
jgi:hypothetical protein